MNTVLYWTGFGERVEIYRYVDGKIFHQYATNKLDFRYHCSGGEKETQTDRQRQRWQFLFSKWLILRQVKNRYPSHCTVFLQIPLHKAKYF